MAVGPETWTWGSFFWSALTGAAFIKILDIGYQEIRARLNRSATAAEFVDRNLDPLLKAADELNGKLRALAERDLKPIHNIVVDDHCLDNRDFASLIYLFGRFWAHVEFIRKEGMSVAMARDKRGAQLQHFFDCLESRRVRIIDRILQRAIGECFLEGKDAVTFISFVAAFNDPTSNTRKWTMPLAEFLSRMAHTSERQILLQHGAVIHAMIDTLDPNHLVTRERPGWPNKLTERSWGDLNYRVFGRYLNFVRGRDKYIGPPKKAARKRKKGGGARGL